MRATRRCRGRKSNVDVIAIRGERLALSRIRGANRDSPEAFHAELLRIIEIDADGPDRGARRVRPRRHRGRHRGARRPLPRRRSGRPRAHVVGYRARPTPLSTGAKYPRHARLCEHRPPTSDKHSTPGDLKAYSVPRGKSRRTSAIYIEAVHRLSDLGAVVTQVTHGTSQEGFEAEWRRSNCLRSKAI